MKVVRWVGGAALAATLGMFSASAQAAPLGSPAEGLRETANQNALTQDVRYGRRCWRHRGHVHCDRGYRQFYGNYYGYGDPYYSGYGYGPGINLYFGGGRGHHHHGHHRRHR